MNSYSQRVGLNGSLTESNKNRLTAVPTLQALPWPAANGPFLVSGPLMLHGDRRLETRSNKIGLMANRGGHCSRLQEGL